MMGDRERLATPERKADGFRRLQVGLTGLVLVALLVGLSTLLTSESRQAAAGASNASQTGAGQGGQSASGDPLTDLGVEPAASEQTGAAQPQQQPQPTPGGAAETVPEVGPIVPDLQPDPELDRPAAR